MCSRKPKGTSVIEKEQSAKIPKQHKLTVYLDSLNIGDKQIFQHIPLKFKLRCLGQKTNYVSYLDYEY